MRNYKRLNFMIRKLFEIIINKGDSLLWSRDNLLANCLTYNYGDLYYCYNPYYLNDQTSNYGDLYYCYNPYYLND